MSEQSAATEDEIVDLARGLIASWTTSSVGTLSLKRGDADLARAGVVFGLAAHVHRVAPIALNLMTAGQVLEAVALVRVAYECALTAQWTAQIHGSTAALANEHIRKRRAFRQTLLKSETLAVWGEKLLEEDLVDTPSNVTLRSFESLCGDLEPGGGDAYAHYRVMSSLCHAGPFLTDFYTPSSDNPFGFSLSYEPEQIPALPYLGFTAAALIWSGRAVDFLDKQHERRSELRVAARRLGITSELMPRPNAMGFGVKAKPATKARS